VRGSSLRITILVWAVLAVAATVSTGQDPGDNAPAAADTSVSLTRYVADVFRDVMVDGEPVSYLLGDVFIDRDTLTVRCDSALAYRDREVFDCRGSVVLTSDTTVLTCGRAVYNDGTGTADFYRDVRIEDPDGIGTSERGELRDRGDLLRMIGGARLVAPSYVVWADTITRTSAGSRGEASGSVRIVDPAAQSLVTGEHAVFSRLGGEAVVDVDPVLISREQGKDELNARARVMSFYQDDRILMVDDVRIRQAASLATADTALIIGREKMLLRGSPRMDDGQGSTFLGNEVEFVYREGELKLVHLRGDARVEDTSPDSLAAIYRGLPPMSLLEGDTITVHFAGGEARRSEVVGSAHSIYVPTDVDDEISFNDVTGDTIDIYFEKGRVAQVEVRGGMEGVYSFARMDELPEPSLGDSLAAAEGGPPLSFDFGGNLQKVDYSGHEVSFDFADRSIGIRQDGRLEYGTMILTADRIDMNTVTRELYANGDPLLEDRAQKIAGRRMSYSFEHKAGAMGDGVTTQDQFYYVGKNIKRFEDGELKIRSGKMTSCDLERPHYHFWSNRMKIKPGDKVVAMPVVMKIGEVPVFALPFYFKSLKTGRRSGILFPSFNFGWSQRTGRYVRDWGYYWATNEYTDIAMRGDYNERRELTWRLDNRYTKRYSFDGSASYSRRTTLGEGDKVKEWQFNWEHSQKTLFDYYQFQARFKMSSQTISRSDLLNDVGVDQIGGQQTSTMYIKRNFGKVNASLNFKRDEFVNKEDEDPNTNNRLSSQSFPQLSLSFKSTSLMPAAKRGAKGSFLGDMLRNTYFSQSYKFGSAKQSYELTDEKVDNASGNASLSVKPPQLWIFKLGAGVSGNHSWTRSTTEGQSYSEFQEPSPDNPDSLVTVGLFEEIYERSESTKTGMTLNSNIGTTLYGVMKPNLGRLTGIRHTFGMGVSHSLAPAIKGKQTRRESYGFSLSNRLDIKYLAGKAAADSTREEKKLDGLLDWRLNTSYNPEATTGTGWSDINSTLQISPGQSRNLTLKVSNLIDSGDFHIKTTRMNYGLNLSGELDTGAEVAGQEVQRNSALDRLGVDADSTAVSGGVDREQDEYEDYLDGEDELDGYEDEFAGFGRFKEDGEDRDPTRGGRYMPWRVGTNLSYTQNHDTGSITARADLNLSLTLTRTWSLKYNAGYDLAEGTVTNQRWQVARDLHCWSLRFSRQISAVDSQYGFIISLKQIPAIKLTRGKEDLAGVGSTLSGGIF